MRAKKYSPPPAYFACHERAEVITPGSAANWTFVYAASAGAAEDTADKTSRSGTDWRAVGQGASLDDARDAAIAVAEVVAPGYAVQKIHSARGARNARESFRETSAEEREAMKGL